MAFVNRHFLDALPRRYHTLNLGGVNEREIGGTDPKAFGDNIHRITEQTENDNRFPKVIMNLPVISCKGTSIDNFALHIIFK